LNGSQNHEYFSFFGIKDHTIFVDLEADTVNKSLDVNRIPIVFAELSETGEWTELNRSIFKRLVISNLVVATVDDKSFTVCIQSDQ
jgi:hypothetical protein